MKHQVAAEGELAQGSSKVVDIDGTNILLFHLDDGYFATQSRCTHLMLPLKKGKIMDSCRLQCPFHRAEFDIRTGEVVKWANFPPGIQLINAVRKEKALKTYEVSVEDGAIYIDFEAA